MVTFEGATLEASPAGKLAAATLSPDARELSLLFEGVECRDTGDPTSKYSALSLDVAVRTHGMGQFACTLLVRGEEDRTSENSFSVMRIQAGSSRATFVADESGRIEGTLHASSESPATIRLSILLLCNAANSGDDECLITLQSIDLAIEAQS